MTIQRSDKGGLISNFLSLSVLQGVNLFLPLLTLPYLVRVLGVENFGLMGFSLSIIMLFNIFVSFGFGLSATREISINRGDIKKISQIFSSVMVVKAFFVVVSLFFLTLLVFIFETIQSHFLLYYITFILVLGEALFPTWFFQGMERMEYITYISVVSKVISTVLIFVIIQNPADYIYFPLLNSLSAVFNGVFAIWFILSRFGVKFSVPPVKTLKSQVGKSYHFFLSRAANDGARYYAVTAIGLSFGNSVVGYYSIVEKLFFAFMSLFGLVAQTIYPYMSRTKDLLFLRKILLLVVIASVVILVPVMVFNEFVVYLIFDIKNSLISDIFIAIFIGGFFGVVSSILGYPGLAAFGYVKQSNNSLIFASLIYSVLITVSAFYIESIQLSALSLSAYAVLGLLFRLYYIKKVGLQIW